MTADAVHWSYSLAPDVHVEPGSGGCLVRTPASDAWIEGTLELGALELLHGTSTSEANLTARLKSCNRDNDTEIRCAALLYQLDRLGLLMRTLHCGGRPLVSCVPSAPVSTAPPERPRDGLLRLSRHALARIDGECLTLEKPGSATRLMIHERALLPLLNDLATGGFAAAMAGGIPGVSQEAILAVLGLLDWCELLHNELDDGWSTHDLLFHARTRRGYARIVLGKSGYPEECSRQSGRDTAGDGCVRIALEPPDWKRLLADDPPHALVAERRKSLRRQGSTPITSTQLSEFLFRTLHESGGRRPYPSGGGCYPLDGYVAVHRCGGLASGLYRYAPVRHELVVVREGEAAVERLLADAAAAANLDRPPQVLVLLAARFDRTARTYGDLAYSLILKEAGAVFQAAMLAAAAMGLAACPLGCGDSLDFSKLAGVSPLVETSVGELILGSIEEP